MIAKDSDAGLANRQVFSAPYCFGPSCAVRLISGSDLKEHLTIQNYADHCEWNLYINIGLHSKLTNSIA
jgi:hypothetical protein